MSDAESIQQTLTGDEAESRRRPGTLLYCEECEAPVLRSRRKDHAHDLTTAPEAAEVVRQELLDAFEVPAEDIEETQSYEVVFHYEYQERVVVEASHKSEAVDAAEREQEYALGGELVQTTHTEKRAVGDPSPPTLDYLEEHAFLPEDHDLTPTDVNRVFTPEKQ